MNGGSHSVRSFGLSSDYVMALQSQRNASAFARGLSGLHRPPQRVDIRPLLVATIQRLPQRTIESIFPRPGTVSPRVAFHTPFGPSKTAVPPLTSRMVHPSIVVGLVSGTGAGLVEIFVRSTAVIAGSVQPVLSAISQWFARRV